MLSIKQHFAFSPATSLDTLCLHSFHLAFGDKSVWVLQSLKVIPLSNPQVWHIDVDCGNA